MSGGGGQEAVLGPLQYRQGLSAGYCREIVEEEIQGVARLEIVKQGLDRYACAGENRLAAQPLLIHGYDPIGQCHEGHVHGETIGEGCGSVNRCGTDVRRLMAVAAGLS